MTRHSRPRETVGPVTISVTVAPVNDAATAATAALQTAEDTAAEIDLRTLAGDVETADDDLVFTVGGAADGTVTLLADGHTARFTPDANHNGPASFTYRCRTPGTAVFSRSPSGR